MEIFKNRKVNSNKLLSYGFTRTENDYTYTDKIVNGQFYIDVQVSETGDVTSKVTDAATDEEYVLVHVESAGGGFVGMVKAEYEAKLKDIADKCFDGIVFGSRQAQEIIAYVRKTYGDELQFLWKKYSENAVYRRKDNDKWYAAMLYVTENKIGRAGKNYVDIIDLKGEPEEIEEIVDGEKYFPAYHMNKKHWFTVCLDGAVPTEEIFGRIDKSYALSAKK